MRVVSVIPLIVFAALLIRGLFAADVVSYTRSDFPQFQVSIGSSFSRQMLAFATPEVNRRWPEMPRLQHSAVPPAPLVINPQTELFSFLGLHELHYSGVQEGSAHNELLIPSWLTLLLMVLPAALTWYISYTATTGRILWRLQTAHWMLSLSFCCIVFALLWIRSYSSLDILHVQLSTTCLNFSAVCGEISFESQPIHVNRPFVFWIHDPGQHPAARIHETISRLHATEKSEHRFLDFQYATLQELEVMGMGRTRSFAAPFWFFTYLLALPLALFVRRRLVRKRFAAQRAGDEESFPSNRSGRMKI